MQIFPAIDLKDKQVVRLTQGDYGKVEVYGQDPAAAARGFAAQGAKYLHVVDLDGAKDGALSNFDAVSAIIAATGMFVEVGGGIRDEARVRAYLEQGAGRVILGTAALRDFAFLQRMVDKYGEKNRRGRGREGRFCGHRRLAEREPHAGRGLLQAGI